MLLALAMLACSPDGPADTGAAAALPEIWGIPAAEDHDPSDGVVEVHLAAGETEVEWLDGEQTEVWAYNGQIPGPLIHANVGDTVRVVLDNELDDETTIHWHGLRIPNEMDGVPAIQDPVQPGESFTYEFVVPDSGSYWYHPHVRSNEQVERGLQGVFVVREADAPTPARERYFGLDDVYLNSNAQLTGFDNLDHMSQMHGRMGNTLLVNGVNDVLEDTVRPQAPERWRIVNTANARTMHVSVEGASWRVIAQDGGILADPYKTDRAELPVGRRLDLEVIPDGDAEEVVLNVELPGSGIGQWSQYPVFRAAVEGEAGDGEWLDWPAASLPAIEDATQEVELVLSGSSTMMGDIAWTINGNTYEDAEDIEVQGRTPSLLRVRTEEGFEHPFHLHGEFFQVVERDGRQVERDRGLLDTILVELDEEVVLYTTFDNPGRWMAHCHILEHAELGMMTELVVSE